MVLMSPSGDLALQQRNLIIASTVLMLLIIIPVMVLTGVFAWRYRESNPELDYDPTFTHSTSLELWIWSAPLLIVIALGAITWITTHTQDPFHAVTRVAAGRPVPAGVKPLKVQAVALDWKWLFLYPDYGIGTLNEMAAPVDMPIEFQITSVTVMNAFSVPALAGMVYAMPAMETQLHAVINAPGEYEGRSGNYSGAGFSDMRFRFLGLSSADFDRWVQKAKDGGGTLERADYLKLARPSLREPVRRWGAVPPGLYHAILNLCVDPNHMCVNDMAAIDAKGGLGLASAYNVARLRYDVGAEDGVAARDAQDYVLALCSTNPDPLWSAAARVASVAAPLAARN
jgi:cytochrome o ubiquinol oxidase subunit 2